MAGCRCAKRFNTFYAECKITGGDCVLGRPNSLLCRSEYLEGPDVTGNEHYYTLVYEELEPYPSVWVKSMTHIWADSKKEAIQNFKKLTDRKVRKIKVLPLIRVLKELTVSCTEKTDTPKTIFKIGYCTKTIITSYNDTIYFTEDFSDFIVIPDGNKSITGIALTENKILVQFKDGDKLKQSSLPIPEELKKLL